MTKPNDDDDLDLDMDLDLDLSLDELELDELPAGESAGKPVESSSTPPQQAGDAKAGSPATPEAPQPGSADEAVVIAATAGALVAATKESDSGSVAAAAFPAAEAGAAGQASAGAAQVEGQWVWQYAAPPPPPSFGAVFFSGRALAELYRFFACGLMVFIGCLMPWGKSMEWVVEHGESTLAYAPPAGFELTVGAISMALALWLISVSCYGIYTGRQKILPVFLMLFPAWFTWGLMLDAWDLVGDLGFVERLFAVPEVAGTGVMLAMFGSTIVTLQLLLVVVKVMRKQPAADGERGRRGKESKAKQEQAKQDKASKAQKKKDRKQERGKDGKDEGAAATGSSEKDGEDKGRSGGRRRGRKR